jgi:hypothetical protein
MENPGRKILKNAGFGLLLLVICLLFTVSILGIMNSEKSSASDSDLIFVRPRIPADSNAFYTLLKATNELYWPGKLENKLYDLSDNTNWDDSLAADILETNRTCLNSFDEAMKQPFLLVPEHKSFDQGESYLNGWLRLAMLKSIQFNSLHRAKKDPEALGIAFDILNFGQRVENSGGPTGDYFIGEDIKRDGLARMRQMAVDTTLSQTNLLQVFHELNAFGPNWEGLTNALKVEYTAQGHYLDDTAKGNLMGTTNSDSERVAMSIVMQPLFSAGKTKVELAQADRYVLAHLSKPYVGIDLSQLSLRDTNSSAFEQLMSGNLMGGFYLEMLSIGLEWVPNVKSRETVSLTATQLMLALKVYDMRHGKLPDSLSELVPEFFPQVPLDDFDGKPFRYLPDKKIIYSVGPCLKDLGGQERTKYSDDNYNLTYKIGF